MTTTAPSTFAAVLRAELTRRCARNPSYSLRAFARPEEPETASRPVRQFQILARDPEATATFYQRLFGWRIHQANALLPADGPSRSTADGQDA
ncbi:MAG TPA: hypothetical protein VFE93_02010, partial [Myxococcaceae bacterium]|nr:hypothetical protein [Myxococcaceae bacterium]